MVHSETSIRLRKAGYVCGVYTIDDEGNPLKEFRYSLHTWDESTGKVEEVATFDTAVELNNMVKLLLPTED